MNNKQPELIINKDRTKWWFLNGKLHREDGPAIEFIGGCKEWWINGKMHRVDGPAIESIHEKEWWLNDQPYSYEEWFQHLTPEQQYNYLWNLDE
jgi:hypothetical protein